MLYALVIAEKNNKKSDEYLCEFMIMKELAKREKTKWKTRKNEQLLILA